MRNIKFISIFAGIGFVLSFFFGLFSHSHFFALLLKALIFGLVFAGLGFLVSFVFNKFLTAPSGEDVIVGENSDIANKNSVQNPVVGQNIDIVVEDEELPTSETDNHFDVGANHQMLKPNDVKEDNNSDDKNFASVGKDFVPLRNIETKENFSGTESVHPNEVEHVSEIDDEQNKEDIKITEDDIDTLPDMENMIFSQDDNSDDNPASFEESGYTSSANTYKKSDGSTADVKDASLIAKAISTALAEEDS